MLFEALWFTGYFSAILTKHNCNTYWSLSNNEIDNCDISTVNDLVSNHYEKLPYPEFSHSKIVEETKYYDSDIGVPFAISPSHTLEKHNHYLHGGNERFRCVSIFRVVYQRIYIVKNKQL